MAEDPATPRGVDPIVQFINEQIKQGYADNEVTPSPVADDSEWMRRVYLDIVGHIPSSEEVEKFSLDKESRKRIKLIDELLENPDYVRNFTTVWTNLCIGQATPRRVSREGMMKFFREAFGRNRPWNDVVYDLVSAEGHFEKNGAVNFLLAQMQANDDAVQMTAKTTRLFMGIQIQCTQCHTHPFNDWKQEQFWQFNAFFRQTRKIDHRKLDAKTGRQVDDFSELVWRDFDGPVFFEKRSGLMQVAFPIFEGKEVDAGPNTDRRKQLAELMAKGDSSLVSKAFVNRTWAYFMGYGFTRPVDDMGPHNAPSHPVLLERLGTEFASQGYDVKKLIRWITSCDAYHLTSRFAKGNERDNPSTGELPLFSRNYVKPMTAEQLYDSLIVATSAHKSGRSNWEQTEATRRQWLSDFVRTFGNDEGEEATSFDGSIPQALMMMNGPLIRDAVKCDPGSHLHDVLTSRTTNDLGKVQKLYLSSLGRKPSPVETRKVQEWMRQSHDPLSFYQDLFWALLNSNEFIVNH